MAKRSAVEKAKTATRLKVTVSRRQIHRYLDLAAGIVPPRPPIPALGNVLLAVKGGKLWMRATNLDIELCAVCDVDGDAEFSAGVNARKLKEIAGLLPSEGFDIYADRSAVRIECGRLYYRMLAMPPKDFPEAFKEPDRAIALPPNFRDLIQSALFSVGSEGSNYALHGAKLEIRKDGRLRLVATNGHALSFVETSCDAGHELDCVLPKQTLSVLSRLLEDENCTMLYGETRVQFKAGDKILSSRTIQGIFPDYERVLPAHSLCATVGRGGFAEAVRRTGLCADGRSNAICATFRDNEIELKAASEETGEAEEIVPADLSLGQTMEAGFNAKYLRGFLVVAPDGDIRIYFKDGRTQFEMRSAESRWTHRYVIMPMAI
jgi:DNA polymerase-3 subunit beta